MCKDFSTLMNWNYAKMDPEDVSDQLMAAMKHLKFSMDLCLEQYKAGRLFLFEHPVGARSWSTAMIQQMSDLEGVHLAKLDFCQLGMKTKDENGEEAAAKKRTGVLTNSKHVVEV